MEDKKNNNFKVFTEFPTSNRLKTVNNTKVIAIAMIHSISAANIELQMIGRIKNG